MRRAAVLGCNPYIRDSSQKTTAQLFEETGGNTGNLAFQFAVAKHLGGDPPIVHYGMQRDALAEIADVIVLPLANQLGEHTDLTTAAERLTYFSLPVIGVGLGAQAPNDAIDVKLSAGTQQWLSTIVDLAPVAAANIGVRGEFTRTQASRFNKPSAFVTTGCPSNFITFDASLGARLEAAFTTDRLYIAVNGGIPHLPKLKDLEIKFADLVTKQSSAYILQHGLEMLQLSRREIASMTTGRLDLCRKYISPQLTEPEFILWCQRYAISFYNAEAWMEYVKRFDFVVGTRFHGAMLAIQAGVPAGCIAHDSRTLEMCLTMGVPVISFDDLPDNYNAIDIVNSFSFNADDYNAKRSALLKSYLRIFEAAEVSVASGLKRLSQNLG